MGSDRKIAVAIDFSKSSKLALTWAIENLLRTGDNLIVIHIMPSAGDEAKHSIWLESGSPLIPMKEFREPKLMKHYGLVVDPEVLDILDTASKQKEVTIVAKIFWGDPRERLCEAVDLLLLDSLVMGSRGHSKMQRILMGSVTSHVLSNATCPLTVIKDPDFKP